MTEDVDGLRMSVVIRMTDRTPSRREKNNKKRLFTVQIKSLPDRRSSRPPRACPSLFFFLMHVSLEPHATLLTLKSSLSEKKDETETLRMSRLWIYGSRLR